MQRIGVWLISALIVYGSLFPFDFQIPSDVAARFRALFSGWTLFSSRGDVLGNILLFAPLGLLHVLGRRTDSLGSRLIGLTWIVGLAVGCQVAQIFVPARTAAMSDVLWNIVGYAVGMGASSIARPHLSAGARPPSWALVLATASIWVAAELAPLVPTLSASHIRDNLMPLLAPEFSWKTAATAAAGVLFVGTMLDALIGPTPTRWWLRGLIAFLVAGKLVFLHTGLEPGTCVGLLLGYGGYNLVRTHLGRDNLPLAALLTVWTAITIRALHPFRLSPTEGSWHWMPFESWLTGSMLANVQSLTQSVFLYAAAISLVALNRRHVLSSSIVLAAWVLVLEIAQTQIEDRSGDVSEPLLVLLVGIVIKAAMPIFHRVAPSAALTPDDRVHPASQPGWTGIAAETIGAIALIAIATGAVLSHPRIPYNVRELFLSDASLPARTAFALAVLWTGFGATILARTIERYRHPLIAWPFATTAVSVASLALLSISVTPESIADIAGSTNLYWFVTNQDIWGSTARAVFIALGSDVIAFLERPVRYAALCAPLFIALACTQLATRIEHGTPTDIRRWSWLCVASLPCLWLAKAIAFDWSSTDNLNELIARDGQWGLGGGGYLYLLLLTIAASAAVIAGTTARLGSLLTAALTLVLSLPAGWWLLNAGLEPHVEKYGKVYSGVQFLLGPDRSTRLAPHELLARWLVLQTASTLLLAEGLRLGRLAHAKLKNSIEIPVTAGRR